MCGAREGWSCVFNGDASLRRTARAALVGCADLLSPLFAPPRTRPRTHSRINKGVWLSYGWLIIWRAGRLVEDRRSTGTLLD